MSKKLEHAEWIKKYKNNFNQNIEVIGCYVNSKTKIEVKCKICGKIYNTLPSIITSGCMCKNCSNQKTFSKFKEELNIINNRIEILGTYKGDSEPILLKCIICGNEWFGRPTHLLRGHGCPKCAADKVADLKRKTQECFEKEIFDTNPSIVILGKYKNRHSPILVKSKICGHMWNASPSNLLYHKTGCPICMMSHGERDVYMYLKSNDVLFDSQKVFNGLTGIGKRSLSYDFYLPKHNILIEYQGEFHDGTANQQTEKEFEIQKEHDRRKKQYASDNNIRLLEIWYWDFDNIIEILTREIFNTPFLMQKIRKEVKNV